MTHARCVLVASTGSVVTLIALACGDGAPERAADDVASAAPLHYLVTAEQVGPVAYRDPLGRVSPDGRWLAYTERDRLHVVPVDGGARRWGRAARR